MYNNIQTESRMISENLEKLDEAMDTLKENLLSIELDIKLDDNKDKVNEVSGQDINSLANGLNIFFSELIN